MVKNLPAVQETQVPSLGWEDPLVENFQPTLVPALRSTPCQLYTWIPDGSLAWNALLSQTWPSEKWKVGGVCFELPIKRFQKSQKETVVEVFLSPGVEAADP